MMTIERVEAFSDAVFSIIMTLLAIELVVPKIADNATNVQYVHAISAMYPKFASFVLSFVIIAIHWVSHHYFFSHLRETPIGLVWLNNLFLLWICFMPFTTALLGDHPTYQFPAMLYGVNQLLAALTFFAFRTYALRNRLYIDKATAREMRPSHSLPAIILFSSSIVLSFVSVYLSLACLLLAPMLYLIPNLMDRKIQQFKAE